jgi:hypothetical protein
MQTLKSKRSAIKSRSAGVKASDCNVVPGGFVANIAHFQKLLVGAGMKPAEVDALGADKGIIFAAAALRAELHNRGILPLAGRAAGTAIASEDMEVPAAVALQVAELTKAVDAANARLPGFMAAALPVAAAAVEALKKEVKSLRGKLDAPSVQRKAEALKQIRQIEAGVHDAQAPLRAAQLATELLTLKGATDEEGLRRKASICRELRALRLSA